MYLLTLEAIAWAMWGTRGLGLEALKALLGAAASMPLRMTVGLQQRIHPTTLACRIRTKSHVLLDHQVDVGPLPKISPEFPQGPGFAPIPPGICVFP